MNIHIVRMTQKYAIEALCWKYEKPYDFYNNVLTTSAIVELLGGNYYALVDSSRDLVGFFCTGRSAKVPAGERNAAYIEDCVDLGLGMNPVLTGKGCGDYFLKRILHYLEQEYKGKAIRLTVATFNKRAIRLYEKNNFIREHRFYYKDMEFITMKRKAK
ncbi:N-acetyltransferase [Oceanobacillus sp. J11TS1]|uniref:GNAT family N-acetyltransferase n=1 Tax=Oceanobacillus sp. J11TS1 TaxID=2807191 RepID=UPI001B27F8A1|nr:GNAT family N-acetyltransferase [Oceanobacillus sp. J11TS1]GIO21542.1 N-acetyltransferase [Oceanobacillus sp. J11TS1]